VGKTGLMAILPYGIAQNRVTIRNTVLKVSIQDTNTIFWWHRKVINIPTNLPEVIEYEG